MRKSRTLPLVPPRRARQNRGLRIPHEPPPADRQPISKRADSLAKAIHSHAQLTMVPWHPTNVRQEKNDLRARRPPENNKTGEENMAPRIYTGPALSRLLDLLRNRRRRSSRCCRRRRSLRRRRCSARCRCRYSSLLRVAPELPAGERVGRQHDGRPGNASAESHRPPHVERSQTALSKQAGEGGHGSGDSLATLAIGGLDDGLGHVERQCDWSGTTKSGGGGVLTRGVYRCYQRWKRGLSHELLSFFA